MTIHRPYSVAVTVNGPTKKGPATKRQARARRARLEAAERAERARYTVDRHTNQHKRLGGGHDVEGTSR